MPKGKWRRQIKRGMEEWQEELEARREERVHLLLSATTQSEYAKREEGMKRTIAVRQMNEFKVWKLTLTCGMKQRGRGVGSGGKQVQARMRATLRRLFN